MQIQCKGEYLQLCGERAIYWPARHMLIVADTHFGKDGVFRSAGLPIPSGINTHDLRRLSALIEHWSVQRLVVLGDFFHGAPRMSGDFVVVFEQWLSQHPALQIDIVAGNHDRHGGAGSWRERIAWHHCPLIDMPFAFAHDAGDAPGAYTLSGHTHPVMRLHGSAGDRARVPVFWFGEAHAVLPSFGFFTGGAVIHPSEHDRVYAIADGQIIAVDPRKYTQPRKYHPRSR